MEDLVNPAPEFWRARRVLVTGHTGFKGAWLWLMLRRLGAEPFGLALPPETAPSLFALAQLAAEPGSAFADIRAAEATHARVAAVQPEIVLHLAAQSLVRRSYAAPVDTFATNVMGTINVLEAVRACASVRSVVVVTSDKCYRDAAQGAALREDDPLGGSDPYSSSKACAEIAAASWRASFLAGRVALATARAGNVIGGGDWAEDRLIPDCVRAFARGEAVTVRHPGARRPWQHVLEPLAGYLLLAERLAAAPGDFVGAWNFGPDERDAQPVERVLAMFAEACGVAGRWVRAPGLQPAEAEMLCIDAAKARERLSWRPRLTLRTALAWTAEWYRRVEAGEPAAALCEAQIDRYLSLEAGA